MEKYLKIGVISLVIIALIYQFIVILIMNKKVEDLSNTTFGNHSQTMDLINNVNLNVQSTLNKELAKTHLTKDINFKLDKVENDKYILNIRVDLSRVSNDSKVYFMYKEDRLDKWIEISLSEDGKLSYTGSMEYNIGSEYKYKVITKGSISESGDITDLDKYEFIPYPPSISYGEDYDVDGEKLSIHVNLNDMYIGDDGNYYESNKKDGGNQEIKSIDIILGIGESEKIYKCKYYEEKQNDIDGTTWQDKGYKVEIPKKDYKNKLNYIKMKITYKNKIVDIKDITSEIEEEYIN